jgi:hypothetical protein
MGQNRRRSWPWVAFGVVAVVLVLCGAGVIGVAASMKPAKDPFVASSTPPMSGAKDAASIVLEVTTPGNGNVSWNFNGVGGTDNGVTFPYRKTLGPFNTSVVVVSMVVQETTGKGGSLQAKITYGDKVFPCEGSGAYAVVTCSGTG